MERLLIVTGAGASYSLGANNEALPLMTNWCDDLVGRLIQHGPSAVDTPDILGLVVGGDSEQFEIRLGRFLAWQRSLDTAGSMTRLGVPAGHTTETVDAWFQQAKLNGNQVFDIINASLSDLFSQDRISETAATAAYSALFDVCGVTPDTPVAYATTNYDVAGELALEALHRRPDWGAPQGLSDSASAPVEVAGLTQGWTAYRAPVLHLHGRVGWYLTPNDQRLMSGSPRMKYSRDIGAPGLLLPDPDKNYAELPAVDAMWTELENLLNTNAKVIVVGHSLHDARLVGLLSEHGNRVAVTYYSDPDAVETLLPGVEPADGAGRRRVKDVLPDAFPIPMRFGPRLWTQESALAPWRDQ